MDFRLNDEQKALQETARRYARERLPALAREIEATGQPPSHELIREFAEQGFLGINVP
jgi:acyl-CoA dehydrogenase